MVHPKQRTSEELNMKSLSTILALSIATVSLSARSAPTDIERYQIISSSYQDQGHYILITKYKNQGQERARFDFCQTELKTCSPLGPQTSYDVAGLKKRIERAYTGLNDSAEQAKAVTIVSGISSLITMNLLVTLGVTGFARGIYELSAYPGDHYKRQIMDTRVLVEQKRRTVSSLADTIQDLSALLSSDAKYLPAEKQNMPPPASWNSYQLHLQR